MWCFNRVLYCRYESEFSSLKLHPKIELGGIEEIRYISAILNFVKIRSLVVKLDGPPERA